MGPDIGAHVAVDLGAEPKHRAVTPGRDLKLAAYLARMIGGH